jgi:hypothetical protein
MLPPLGSASGEEMRERMLPILGLRVGGRE